MTRTQTDKGPSRRSVQAACQRSGYGFEWSDAAAQDAVFLLPGGVCVSGHYEGGFHFMGGMAGQHDHFAEELGRDGYYGLLQAGWVRVHTMRREVNYMAATLSEAVVTEIRRHLSGLVRSGWFGRSDAVNVDSEVTTGWHVGRQICVTIGEFLDRGYSLV